MTAPGEPEPMHLTDDGVTRDAAEFGSDLACRKPVLPAAEDEHRHLDVVRVPDGGASPVEGPVGGSREKVERGGARWRLAELRLHRLLEQGGVGVAAGRR